MTDRKSRENLPDRTLFDSLGKPNTTDRSEPTCIGDAAGMLTDEQRYTYLPLGDADDLRVKLMEKHCIPLDIMPEVWRNAMRVQGALQKSANDVLHDAGGRDNLSKDHAAGLLVSFAIGLGLGCRNIGLGREEFSGLVTVAAMVANDFPDREGIRKLAEANGHSTTEPVETKPKAKAPYQPSERLLKGGKGKGGATLKPLRTSPDPKSRDVSMVIFGGRLPGSSDKK